MSRIISTERANSLKRLEVLLIEDNAADILLIRQALAAEPFPVRLHLAKDGEQGVAMLTARYFEPDVVILDLNLPKLSGLSVLEQCHPHVPVVVFSSFMSDKDIQRSFELGVKDFVPKPSDLKSYEQVVMYIVERWGSEGRFASPDTVALPTQLMRTCSMR